MEAKDTCNAHVVNNKIAYKGVNNKRMHSETIEPSWCGSKSGGVMGK